MTENSLINYSPLPIPIVFINPNSDIPIPSAAIPISFISILQFHDPLLSIPFSLFFHSVSFLFSTYSSSYPSPFPLVRSNLSYILIYAFGYIRCDVKKCSLKKNDSVFLHCKLSLKSHKKEIRISQLSLQMK